MSVVLHLVVAVVEKYILFWFALVVVDVVVVV